MPHLEVIYHFLALLAVAYAVSFPKDGTAGADFKQWEIVYRAENFKPVCGVSNEIEGSDYWSNSPDCEVAMSYFNQSSELVQVYDTAGGISTAQLPTGEKMCLCFSLLHALDDVTLDICMLFGEHAELYSTSSLWGEVTVGIQCPNYAKGALPQCNEIEAPASTPTATTTKTNPSSTSVSDSSNQIEDAAEATTSDSSSGGGDNDDGGGSGGLSTEAIIGLGCGLPGALVALAVIFTYFKKCYRKGGKVDRFEQAPAPLPQPPPPAYQYNPQYSSQYNEQYNGQYKDQYNGRYQQY